MARKSFQIINRPKSAKLQYLDVRREARKTGETVAERRLKRYQAIVANWENQPEFGVKFSVTKRGISLWIDFTGTKPHPIKAKNAPVLSFLWGGPGSYSPKTRPVGIFGGPGIVSGGNLVAFLEVDHPGFPPRLFTEDMNRQFGPKDKRDLYNAYRRGFRRATK
jgi:hypothetical protein